MNCQSKGNDTIKKLTNDVILKTTQQCEIFLPVAIRYITHHIETKIMTENGDKNIFIVITFLYTN